MWGSDTASEGSLGELWGGTTACGHWGRQVPKGMGWRGRVSCVQSWTGEWTSQSLSGESWGPTAPTCLLLGNLKELTEASSLRTHGKGSSTQWFRPMSGRSDRWDRRVLTSPGSSDHAQAEQDTGRLLPGARASEPPCLAARPQRGGGGQAGPDGGHPSNTGTCCAASLAPP